MSGSEQYKGFVFGDTLAPCAIAHNLPDLSTAVDSSSQSACIPLQALLISWKSMLSPPVQAACKYEEVNLLRNSSANGRTG